MSSGQSLGHPKIPFWRKFGWGVGSLGTALLLNIQTIFYSNFLIDFVGIGAATVGALLLVTKLFDLATDLPMGWVSDRTRTRFGRRRPYLLIGSLLCGAGFVMIFNPSWVADGLLLPFVLASLLFLSLAYTIYAVPYIAVPSEMTDDTHARSQIMSWRVMFSIAATTFGATATGLLIDAFGGGQSGFSAMSWVLGGVIALSCLVAFFSVSEQAPASAPNNTEPALHFGTNLRLLAENKPFMILLSAKLMQLFSFALNIGIQIFFFTQVLGLSFSAFGLIAVWGGVATILAVQPWTLISKSIGKRNAYMWAAGGLAIVNLTWLLAAAGEPIWVTTLRFICLGLFGSGQILMGLSVLTDTIEYDRRRTGLRREGFLSGVYTSAEKFAFAFAPAMSGLYLSAAGYVPGLGSGGDQPASAITAIYVLLAVIPAILNVGSVVCLYFYRLDDETIKATRVA